MVIQDLLNLPPSYQLDFFWLDKRRMIPNLFPTICAFLNSDGGKIVIGYSREQDIQSLSQPDIDRFSIEFRQLATGHKGFLNPAWSFNLSVESAGSDMFIIIEVPKGNGVFKSGDKVYVRNRSENEWLEDFDRINKLYQSRRGSSEREILPNLSINDLDLGILNKIRGIVERRDTSHKWLSMSDKAIIESSMLYRKDQFTSVEGYTRAAVLLLGKDTSISGMIPGYKLDIFIRKENVDRWDDRKIIETNLIDTRSKALEFLKGYLPEDFYLEGVQRMDLRDLILREVIGNVIVHRDYGDPGPTDIVVGNDRIVARNPNIVHYHKGPLDLDNFVHYPKNPVIRRFFNELGWSDEAGSGIRNVKKYLDIYTKGAKPDFIEDDQFTTIIPLKVSTIGNHSVNLMGLFSIATSEIDVEHQELLSELPLSSEVSSGSDEEFAQKYMGTLIKNGGNLIEVKLLKERYMKLYGNENMGSWKENGGNPISKKGRQLLKTLIGLLKEKSLEESARFLGFKNKESFRENYLNPLRKDFLVTLTIPDRPNDPNQKYIITDRGRSLLSGQEI